MRDEVPSGDAEGLSPQLEGDATGTFYFSVALVRLSILHVVIVMKMMMSCVSGSGVNCKQTETVSTARCCRLDTSRVGPRAAGPTGPAGGGSRAGPRVST